MLGMSPNRFVATVICVGIASSLLLAGCSDPREAAGVGVSGCQREIDGTAVVTRTETSKLTCDAINDLVSSIPSQPESFLIRSDSPRLFWNCSYFGTDDGAVLLRCEHGQRHFSIVKRAG
jgi:hypothetical protein